jgi:hypothetical protein
MIRNSLTFLRLLIGLALMLSGGWVLIRGGVSHTAPFHLNWGCIGLGLGLFAPGAFLLRLGFFLPGNSGRPATK